MPPLSLRFPAPAILCHRLPDPVRPPALDDGPRVPVLPVPKLKPGVDLTTSPEIPLGFVPVSGAYRPFAHAGPKSLMLYAPTRSGKGTCQLVPTLLSFNDGGSLVINDPKGQLAAVCAPFLAATGRKVIFLNPFGVLVERLPWLQTARFNPLAGLDQNSGDFTPSIETMVEGLILKSGAQSHFYEGARSITTALCEFFVERSPAKANLPAVNQALNLPREEFVKLALFMSRSRFETARTIGAKFSAPEVEKSAWEQLADAQNQMRRFLSPSAIRHVLSGDDFRWDEVKRGNCAVFIILPEAEAKTYFRFTRLIYASAMKAMLRPPKTPVLFMLDELATSLGNEELGVVETAFSLGSGYGVRVQAVFQNWPQAEALFGDRAMSMLSGSAIQQWFQPNDGKTADMLTRRGGTGTSWYQTASQSFAQNQQTGEWVSTFNVSQHVAPRPRLDADLLYALGPARQVIFKEGIARPIMALRRPYFKDPVLNSRAFPDPYES